MKINQERTNKALALICGIGLTIYGLIFVLAWHLGDYPLLTFGECKWPLPYPAAIAIFLSGLALVGSVSSFKLPWTNLLGLIILIIGLAGIFGYFFSIDFGMDKLLRNLFLKPITNFPALVIFGSFGFSLIGLDFLLWPYKTHSHFKSNALLLLSLLIFFIGSLDTLSYLIPIKTTFGAKGALPIHCYSAFGQLFIGLGLISASLYTDIRYKIGVTRGIPIIVAISFATFSIFLSMGLKEEKISIIEQIISSKSDGLKKEINFHLNDQIASLIRSGQELEIEQKIQESWQQDEIKQVKDRSELTAIYLVDSTGKVQFKYSENEENLNLGLLFPDTIKDLLENSQKEKKSFLSVLADVTGKFDLIFYFPVTFNQTEHGFLINRVDALKFFDNALSGDIYSDYALEVFYKENKIAWFNESIIPSVNEWKLSNAVTYKNITFHYNLYPTPLLLSLQLSDTMIYFTLFGGFIIALTLGFLVYLWMVSRERLELVEKTKVKLQEVEENQRLALWSANMGTWSWDIKKNILYWDEYAATLLGLQAGKYSGSYEDFLQQVYPEDKEKVINSIQSSLRSGSTLDLYFRVIQFDNNIHHLLTKGKVFSDSNNFPEKMTGVIWDISILKHSENLLATSEAITKILSEEQSLTKAAPQIIEILHHFLDWDLLIIWYWDAEKQKLQCVEFAESSGKRFPHFRQAVFDVQTTVPQYIWATYKPVWFKDVSLDSSFKRSKAAKEDNIKGALAFPIYEKARLTGVIELFKRNSFVEEIDEGMRNLMISLGIEIGQFIHRKRTEKEMAELAAIVTFSNEGIYSCDATGIIKSWNLGAEKIYGWKAYEMIGESIRKIYLSEKEFITLRDSLFKSKESVSFQGQRITKDGRVIWVQNSISPIFDEEHNLISYSIIVVDITHQKQMVIDLQKSEEKFRDFVETTEEWIWEMSKEHIFTYSNPFIERLLGYLPREVEGKDMLLFIPEKSRQSVEKEFQNFRERKKGWTQHTLVWRHKNGSLRYLESNAEPIFNEHHELTGFRGADRDITERQNIEKSKNEFISMVSHELRTPLTSIFGAIDLLLADEPKDEKTKDLLSIAHRNSQRLTTIINDILDTEKIQLGKLELNITIVTLADAVKEAILLSKPAANRFSVELVEEGHFPDSKVNADYGRLLQVIMNILSNAIKFSPPGGSVYIYMAEKKDKIRVSIRDEGPGIPLDFQPKIFEKFAQADTSDSRSAGGTGLGLNISKNIIESLGGMIGFKTEEGIGTTFFFELTRLEDQ